MNMHTLKDMGFRLKSTSDIIPDEVAAFARKQPSARYVLYDARHMTDGLKLMGDDENELMRRWSIMQGLAEKFKGGDMKYSHAYTIAFEVESNDPNGDDVTNEMISLAIKERIRACNSEEDADLLECCGAPFDTYKL